MKLKALAIATALFLAPTAASAQTAAVQTLTTCMNGATTAADNTVLMRWIFVAMARHPDVREFSNVTDAQRVATNRQMAALMNRLLLDACPTQTAAALREGGADAIGEPFSEFGKRAMTELLNHPDVNAGIVEMSAYLDTERFSALTRQH